ncbi:MAG: GntR family transcriptional regulator [Pararhodobacter sp.]|nr:GntR family transcriptional regulator [Pararhodobacter sp.]
MTSQTETIVRALHARIDTGALNPGDELDEAALAVEFGVSRTPVREALMRIEATGLLRRLPRRGAVLFKPTLEEFLAILEVHAKLEGQAAGLAARRRSVASVQRIDAAVTACATHLADLGETAPDAYYQHNLAFHAAVAEAAGNPFLLDHIKTNARKLMAYYRARYAYAGSIASSVADHRAIAALIAARDSAGAEEAMRRHVQFDQVTALDLLTALG